MKEFIIVVLLIGFALIGLFSSVKSLASLFINFIKDFRKE